MKLVLRILGTYLVLTLLFTAALAAVFCNPKGAIEGHVRQSVQQVTDDGLMFTTRVGEVEPWKVGTFSDCLILGIAYCADSSHPLASAMNDQFLMVGDSPVKGARLMLSHPDDPSLRTIIYCRYWHGNQLVVRPLLCITTVHGMRIINIVLLTLLWLTLLAVMWRRIGRASALIVMGCLAAVMVPTVPLCLNYVPTFYIALLASLAILCWQPATSDRDHAVITFFVIGAVTTYFDLLTTPMVALAVPLIVYMLYRKPTAAWRTVIMLSLAWLTGYAALCATKWLLAALITGQRWCLKATTAALAAVIIITATLTALFGKSWQTLRRNSWMLLVAMASFVWAFVLLEHTWHHLHFTWRTFAVLAIGIMLFLWHSLDLRHPFALFKKD